MTEDFEQTIVQGKAHWIASFVYEPAASRLVIGLTDDVDSGRITRVVEFTGIQQLESQWTDRDEQRIEGLLGADENELAGLVRYFLVTDQREIEILSSKNVVVQHCR
jgi:hypothetical protein